MDRQELIEDFQHFLDTHKEEVQAHICQPPYDWMDEDDWEEVQENVKSNSVLIEL